MKNIFILIENFYPAYKGGGPIQSITNLILSLDDSCQVYVITSAYDLQSKSIMPNIIPDTWNSILLPQSKKSICIWYGNKGKPSYSVFKKMVHLKKPHIVYLNGIYSYNLFLLPLLVIKNLSAKYKLIISPRGMLQKGSLSDKSFKKKIYLKALNFFGLVTNVVWHATNNEEENDIKKIFDKNSEVIVAANFTKKPLSDYVVPIKLSGSLNLIYLSLITEKKNLLLLLQLIKCTENITLDIYGPIKDKAYWNECQKLVHEMDYKIKYRGDILPVEVQNTFSKYHASILLTKGENFGHALYESLSVGRPIITSNYTPWNDLENKKAGWNLNISDFSQCIIQLNKIKGLDQAEFSSFCDGAYQLANDYYKKSNNIENYKKLFSIN